MQDLKYNVEKEVAQAEYNFFASKYPGLFARRSEGEKFFIKPMFKIKSR